MSRESYIFNSKWFCVEWEQMLIVSEVTAFFIFFVSKGSSEPDEASILLSFDKPHQLFTVKADILTWKQQIKNISTCSRQEAETRGGGARGSGTGRFNCIIIWNQSQTKDFIATLNSHLAGCNRDCLQGCSAVCWPRRRGVRCCSLSTGPATETNHPDTAQRHGTQWDPLTTTTTTKTKFHTDTQCCNSPNG